MSEIIEVRYPNESPIVSLLKNTHAIVTNRNVVPTCKNSFKVGKNVCCATIEVLCFLFVLNMNDGRKRIE